MSKTSPRNKNLHCSTPEHQLQSHSLQPMFQINCSKHDKAYKNTGMILQGAYKRCMSEEKKATNSPVCNLIALQHRSEGKVQSSQAVC